MNLNRRVFTGASLGALLAGCGAREPDLIVHGGPIYTGALGAAPVEAVRIRQGRFSFVGALGDARALGSGAREVDLGGAAAFPGFIDSHVHLPGVGMAAMLLDLVGVESIAAMTQRLGAYAASHAEGAILGRGWIETHWPERRFPTRADLDTVVGDRPVLLERIDGHAAVVNSAALALAGIDANTPDPAGGRIERDGSGAATGMLIDNAVALVQRRFPAPTPAMQREALVQGARLYASRGWARVGNMSTTGFEAELFQQLAANGELPLSADLYLEPDEAAPAFARGPYGEGAVRVRGAKLYVDGALGSRGAALLAPYSDAPSDGLVVTPLEELRDLMRGARERGLQVAAHAIGDRGNRIALDAFRDTFADDPGALREARWRIEHAQVISQQDLPRFAQMGVIASMQPSHAISDLHFAPSRLGDARLAGAYAWKSLLESGAMIAAGSDAPVEKGDPLIEFYAAIHRHDLQGFAGSNWRLEEVVSREQALTMFTSAGAYAAMAEAETGVIEVGKNADLSAFSVDLMTAEPAAIPAASAVLTIANGSVTHQSL